MARLLAGEAVEEVEPLTQVVLGGAFWCLAASEDHPRSHQAWFQPGGEKLPVYERFCHWAESHLESASATPKGVASIAHYVLLPKYDWGVADYHLSAIQPLIKSQQPTIGFSLQEAAQAKRVTVVGTEEDYPESALRELRSCGCIVERIEGENGTMAANLASLI